MSFKINPFTGQLDQVSSYASQRFIELTDTPTTYSGHAGDYFIVSNNESGLEYKTSTGSATTTISGWDASGDFYSADFNHNLNTDEISVFLVDTVTNKEVGAEDIEIVSVNTVKIYISDDTSILKVNVISGGFGTNYISFSPDYTVYVAKNGSDSAEGTRDNPFLTIQAGIDYAIAEYPTLSDDYEQVVVFVSPGVYTEQIHSVDGVHIVGTHYADNRYSKAVRLVNDGTDESNYPIRSLVDDRYRMFGINIETTDGTGILGKLPRLGIFGGCFFLGQWIENDLERHYVAFEDCDLRDNNGMCFNLTGTTLSGSRYIEVRHSIVYQSTPTFSSTHVSSATITIEDNSTLTSSAFKLSGDWNLRAIKSNIANGREVVEGRSYIGGTGDINIIDCLANSGLHFTEDPTIVKMYGINFSNGYTTIPDGESDITVASGIIITNVEYSGNNQHNGLCGNFQIASINRNVGAFSDNRYGSLACAIDSIPASGTGTITLYDDFTDLDKFVLNEGASVTIIGKKTHSLSFTGDIVTLGHDQELYFNEINTLTGENLDINGDNAILSFEGCLSMNGYITTTSGAGSFMVAYFSTLRSIDGHPVLTINNTDTLCVSGYSRLKGYTGQPAIVFNEDADDKLKVKYSTLLHGTGLTNAPLVNNAVGKVDIAIYASALNAAFSTATFTNTIGSPNNTVSNDLDF